MRILITAGPTREPIDDVRFISNRSSGQLGIALAQAATDAGHDTTLLLGPVLAPAALGDRCDVARFTTCDDLRRLLARHFPDCDTLVMAAAVADYRPLHRTPGKLPRNAEGRILLELEPTPDLVAEVAAAKRPGQKVVAFALEEPAALESRALEKMRRKSVDAIVANPLTAMEAAEIDALLLDAHGRRRAPGPLSKVAFARWLMREIPNV